MTVVPLLLLTFRLVVPASLAEPNIWRGDGFNVEPAAANFFIIFFFQDRTLSPPKVTKLLALNSWKSRRKSLVLAVISVKFRWFPTGHWIEKQQNNTCFDRKVTDIFTRLHRAQTARVFLFILILFATGGSVLSVNTDRPWEISEIYCLTAFVFLTWPQKCRCQKAGEIKSLNHCCLRCLPTSAGMLYCWHDRGGYQPNYRSSCSTSTWAE